MVHMLCIHQFDICIHVYFQNPKCYTFVTKWFLYIEFGVKGFERTNVIYQFIIFKFQCTGEALRMVKNLM